MSGALKPELLTETVITNRRKRLTSALVVLLGFVGVLGILLLLFGDIQLTEHIEDFSRQHPKLRSFMKGVTDYGNYIYYFFFIGMILYGAVTGKKKILKAGLVYLLIQLAASCIISRGLKIAVGRPRPGHGGTHRFFSLDASYNSFPSGHSTDAFCSAGTLWMYSAGWVIPTLSCSLSLLIAISRIFTGAHYLLDVTAGITIGSTVSLVISYLFLHRITHSTDTDK